MAGVKTYIAEAADELVNKVTWPSWADLQQSSLIVLVASFLIAGVVYLMDSAFGNIMKLLYNDLFN